LPVSFLWDSREQTDNNRKQDWRELLLLLSLDF
jgi:DNA mismatch repair protein MutH